MFDIMVFFEELEILEKELDYFQSTGCIKYNQFNKWHLLKIIFKTNYNYG